MHPLEVPWKRAQIHEAAIDAFHEEAEARDPKFFPLAKRLYAEHAKGLTKKHASQVRNELWNLAHAADAVRSVFRAYAHDPEELYFALFGRRPAVTFDPHTFCVSFEVSRPEMNNINPSASGHAYPPVALIEKGDPDAEKIMEARDEVRKRTGYDFWYVRGLTTLLAEGKRHATQRHEEDHVISYLLDAHRELPSGEGTKDASKLDRANAQGSFFARPPRLPKWEEAYAYWPGYRNARVLAHLLTRYYGVAPTKRGEHLSIMFADAHDIAHHAGALEPGERSRLYSKWGVGARHLMYRQKSAAFAKQMEAEKALGKPLERANSLIDEYALALDTRPEAEQEKILAEIRKEARARLFELSDSLEEEAEKPLEAKLRRLRELQKRNGLSDRFMQSLLRRNKLDRAIRIIEFNSKKSG